MMATPAPTRAFLGGRLWLWLVLAALVLLILATVGLFVGSTSIGVTVQALFGHSSDLNNLLVRDFRLARIILGISVGAALAVAGVLVQATTQNPLADPGLLGINSGAYLAVVIGLNLGGRHFGVTLVLWALLGSTLAAAGIYLLARLTSRSPAQLILAGVAIAAVLSGIGYLLTLLNQNTFSALRFWSVGSLDGRQFGVVIWTVPIMVAGLVMAQFLGRGLNALALGREVATSQGSRAGWIQLVSFVSIVLISASATAAVGPISFLGLIVAHVCRVLAGSSWRRVLVLALLVGPIIFLGSDIFGRLIAFSEVPVGVVVAFVGAPLLIFMARRVKQL